VIFLHDLSFFAPKAQHRNHDAHYNDIDNAKEHNKNYYDQGHSSIIDPILKSEKYSFIAAWNANEKITSVEFNCGAVSWEAWILSNSSALV
jgi:hypothetical protein